MATVSHSKDDFRFAIAIILPVIIFLILTVSYPLGYAIFVSVHELRLFGGLQFKFIGFDNFAAVLGDARFWSATAITLRFVVESTVVAMLVGVSMALILARKARWKAVFRSVVILPWAVSLYSTGVMFASLVRDQTGIVSAVGNLLGLSFSPDMLAADTVVEMCALANAWNIAPLVTFFVLTNLETIPRRLYDLAKVDRLTGWETFVHVTIPPLKFTLFVLTSVVMVFSFKVFDLISVMTNGGPARASQTLTLELVQVSFAEKHLGYGAAMSFYLLAIILLSSALLYFAWGRRIDR